VHAEWISSLFFLFWKLHAKISAGSILKCQPRFLPNPKISYVGVPNNQPAFYFYLIYSIFLERTAKALPRFLLDEERKKATAHPVFLMKTGPKNHTTKESVSLILHNFSTTGQLSKLTPPIAPTWSN
jgi:hypothetical protein